MDASSDSASSSASSMSASARTVAGVSVPDERLRNTLVVNGAPARLVHDIAIERRRQGERLVVGAMSGKEIAQHFRPGVDVLLSRGNPHSHRWNVFDDVHTASEAESMCRMLAYAGGTRDEQVTKTEGWAGILLKDTMVRLLDADESRRTVQSLRCSSPW